MRSMWKGAVSFGLVSIPVKLYASCEDHTVHFKQLHKECKTPIKYEKICPVCNKPVKEEDIVKGYEYEPGKYVIIDENDLERIPSATAKSIEIVDFADISQIDPIYYDKTYFISPDDVGSKPFILLRDAMNKTGRVAVAKVVIRSKQDLSLIRTYNDYMVLETMHFPDEIRKTGELPPLKDVDLHENEVKMAEQLIDTLTSDFNPDKYTDEYRKALMEIIESKINGEQVVIPEKQKDNGNVLDLVGALKASIKAADKEAKPKRSRKKGA